MPRTRAPSRSRVRREEVTRGHDVDGLVGALGDAGRGERGDKGVIMLTDGQRNWRQESTPSLNGIGLSTIACPRPDVCYIVGSGGTILKGS